MLKFVKSGIYIALYFFFLIFEILYFKNERHLVAYNLMGENSK